MPVLSSPIGPVIGTLVTWSPSVREDIDATYTIKNADINATTSGDTTVVTAVTDKKIRVFSLFFSVSADVAIAWKSGASTTKVEAATFLQGGGHNSNWLPGWCFETDASGALVINLSANSNVRGWINYIEV